MKLRSIAPCALFIALLFTACVPQRKYEELQTSMDAMRSESEAALAKARDAQATLDAQASEMSDLKRRVKLLEQDTTTLGTSLRKMQQQYDKINALNDELLDKYNKLLAGDRSENRKLLTDLEALRLDLQNKEDSIARSSKRLAEREARLSELQVELDRKDAAMRDLKDRVSRALTGFEGKGLTVEQRDGRIHVSLENKLLFPSGSATVDKQGREALVKLAKAIEADRDISILVEGHTDTDKILPGSTYKDNWELSVERATSVVRILQEASAIEARRITAAGRSEYVPVDPADKSKNRRIEVILTPDLSALYNMVKD
ncbi:MAG: OmpA family protein [Flavobacteriales bacterium]|jgi:chemotaxis protein MotB|nr:OmpA family protein [Flavobacteriales bacterium]MBK7942808.1 OmpA family protein [Flavobacteriales bacterium]MBK8949543.1 OmpA family protein [Flavobacteriales bacterium]MBK9698790.1 OmpA family protein [Flavobacteriales bacterium]